MIIRRVEHPELLHGPYRGNDEVAAFFKGRHYNDPRHPVVNSWNLDTDYVCGFSCATQFYDWFSPEERRTLRDNGYVLNLYDVNPRYVMRFKKQVMFNRELAELIMTRRTSYEYSNQ